jgi:hypothetical protein
VGLVSGHLPDLDQLKPEQLDALEHAVKLGLVGDGAPQDRFGRNDCRFHVVESGEQAAADPSSDTDLIARCQRLLTISPNGVTLRHPSWVSVRLAVTTGTENHLLRVIHLTPATFSVRVVGQAIGQILPFALGVAISPIPIIGVVLMLATPRARVTGLAFLGGWIAGLAILGTVVLLISSGANASSGGQPATWVGILKLVLGALLLLVAVKQWRGRPHGDEPAHLPKWMEAIDHLGGPKALGLGALLAAANPKNGLMTVGAGAAIAQTGIDAGQQAVVLAIFVVLASVGVAAPVVLFFALGDRSVTLLGELKDWMASNNAVIMAVLMLVIGVKLIGDGITALAS